MLLSNNTSTLYNYTYGTWTGTDWMTILEFLNQLRLAMKILYIFSTVLIIMGNTLVLLTTWRDKRLHQPNKYFIACLAVADLFVGLYIGPLKFYYSSVSYNFISGTSVHLCRFFAWVDALVFTASIYTLTFISYDRYLKISKPLQYKSRMTITKSFRIIFTIWLISVSFATYAATPGSGSVGILIPLSLCLTTEINKYKTFNTILSVCVYFVPAIVIMVMYASIFVVVHKRHKMLQNGELGETCSNLQRQRRGLRQDLKIIRTLLVVVGVFIICWFPLVIYKLLFFYKSNIFYWYTPSGYMITVFMSYLVDLLPLMNSLCNPLIYACLDQTYKEAFKSMFQRMMCQRNT